MGFNSKINQKADEILNNKRLEALHNQNKTNHSRDAGTVYAVWFHTI